MESGKPRALIDTNVLFGHNNRKKLIQAKLEGLYEPYWSPAIIGELYRIHTWKWIQDRRGTYNECSISSKKMMRTLSSHFNIVNPGPNQEIENLMSKSDIDDTPIAEAAIDLGESFLLTNNPSDFYPLEDVFKALSIKCVSPSQFFREIGFLEI